MHAAPLRILLIDDDPDDRRLAMRELSRGFPGADVAEVADRRQFDVIIGGGGGYDLIITDFELKWSDGISVLRSVKSKWPDAPVIMFTASGSQEVAVEAMKAGLDDYVIKSPRHFVRLNLAVQTCLRKAHATRRATLLEVRQQQLLNRLAVGVCRLSMDGTLLECNPAFLRLCGAGSLDSARELDLASILPPTGDLDYLLRHPSDDRYHVDREATLLRSDGTALSVSVNATLSTGTAGAGEKVVDGVVEDVTERRKMIDDLRAANRAKDLFLALVSHELRTPLTPVLAAVSAMEADPRLPDDLRDDVRVVRRNVELEARLVNDLLDLSGLATGNVKLHLETVDVHAAVRREVEAIRAQVAEKKLTVTFAFDAPNPYAWADPMRIRQVLANLLANAIKFTPGGGGGTLTFGTAAAGAHLLLRVSDTGIGIAPAHLPHIFDAFNQGDVAVTRRYGGLGLGLSISKAIMEAHGGSLSVESKGPGSGATFTLHLKAADAPAAESAPAAHPKVAPSDERRPLRVLLVEDHDDTRHLMSRLLRSLGHAVTTAAAVRDAMGELEKAKFDLLLSDLGLPDGTGWDLMRQVAGKYQITGIALSGFGSVDDIQRSNDAGFAEHLTKPVDLQTLGATITRVARPTSRP